MNFDTKFSKKTQNKKYISKLYLKHNYLFIKQLTIKK